jgi:TatA/E family protein of Tat protein translocase
MVCNRSEIIMMQTGNLSALLWIYYLITNYWVVIVVVFLLLLGAKKLPEIARWLGQNLGEFKRARDEFEGEIHKSTEELQKGTSHSSKKPKLHQRTDPRRR